MASREPVTLVVAEELRFLTRKDQPLRLSEETLRDKFKINCTFLHYTECPMDIHAIYAWLS